MLHASLCSRQRVESTLDLIQKHFCSKCLPRTRKLKVDFKHHLRAIICAEMSFENSQNRRLEKALSLSKPTHGLARFEVQQITSITTFTISGWFAISFHRHSMTNRTQFSCYQLLISLRQTKYLEQLFPVGQNCFQRFATLPCFPAGCYKM